MARRARACVAIHSAVAAVETASLAGPGSHDISGYAHARYDRDCPGQARQQGQH